MGDDPLTLPGLPAEGIIQRSLRQIQERTAAIPPGKTRVGVFYYKPDGSVGGGVAIKINDEWTFSADVEWQLKTRPDAFIGFSWSR